MWEMKSFTGLLVLAVGCLTLVTSKCPNAPQGMTKLVCYYEGRAALDDVDPCGCTHLVYTGEARGDRLADISKKLITKKPKLKILLRTTGKDKELAELVKSSTIHGVDLHEVHSSLNRTRITTTVESIRTAIGTDAILMLTLPAQSELLAKYYDLKSLTKPVSLFGLETHFLGDVEKETFHPSRLSGVWDMMNTDSVVDLAVGLGVPSSKIIITTPANAFKFQLTNTTLSTPGSPTKDSKPRLMNQKALCKELNNGEKWTLERDQDLSAPYAFKDDNWLAFEDASSLDVKGKYTRIRGLAGIALVSIDDDSATDCGSSLLQTIAKGLGTQSRAPRGAVLSSLENDILSVPHSNRLVDAVQLSPYRISRVVDSDGVIHAIREDTRTEFECQRQGYFVHPRSCNRFYRCVKFDQLSDEYTVFEFDCPTGLAFDSRYEVCVWPGSLASGQACPGSSEIAPVPHTRFVCPEKPGYYADPENCRWFFACLDHGKAPFSAYEFRCPFGLGFDESKLICDWPWLVPGCGNLGRYEATAHGHASSVLTGASAYIGTSANSVNVAAHQSLVSGASTSNLVGIQSGYGTHYNAASNGYDDGSYDSGSYQGGYDGSSDSGKYNGEGDYSAGNGDSGAYLATGQHSGNDGSYSSSNHQSGNNGAYSGSNAYKSGSGGAYSGSNGYQSGDNGAYSASVQHSGNDGSYSSAGDSGAYLGSNAYKSGSGGAYSGSKGYQSGQNGAYSASVQHSGNDGSYSSAGDSGAYLGSNAYKSGSSGAYSGSKGYQSGNSGAYSASVQHSGNDGSYSLTGDSGAYLGSNAYKSGSSGAYSGSKGYQSGNNGAYSASVQHSGNAGSYSSSGDSGAYSGSNAYTSGNSGAYSGSKGYQSGNNGAYSASIQHSGNDGSYSSNGDSGAYTGSNAYTSGNSGAYSGSKGYQSGQNGAYSASVQHSGNAGSYSSSGDSGAYKGSNSYKSGSGGAYSGSNGYTSGDNGAYVSTGQHSGNAGSYSSSNSYHSAAGGAASSGAYKSGGKLLSAGSYAGNAGSSSSSSFISGHGASGAYSAGYNGAAGQKPGTSPNRGLFFLGTSGLKSSAYGNAYATGNYGTSSSLGSADGGYYDDDSGEYRHDYSGEYRHDGTGDISEKALPYQHVEGSISKYSGAYDAGTYQHVIGPSGGYGDDGSYKDGGAYVSSGQYDNSGDYKSSNYQYNGAAGSGGYKDAGEFGYSYQTDNSGAYNGAKYQHSGNYQHNSGLLLAAGASVLGSSDANSKAAINNIYVNHGSSNDYLSKGSRYSSGSNVVSGYATTGAAHTLTAGAINSGLVGKTTLVDADLLHSNAYSHSSGSHGSSVFFGNTGSSHSNGQYSSVTSAPAASFAYQPASVSSHYEYSGHQNANGHLVNGFGPSVTPATVIKYQQPISVTPLPQLIPLVKSPPKSDISQIFTYQKPALSYVQPLVTVSSTPKTVVYQQQIKLQQPLVSVTGYNKPSVVVQQTYHGENEYQKYSTARPLVTVTQAPIAYESHRVISSGPRVTYSQPAYVSSTPRPIKYKQPAVIAYPKPTVTHYQNPLISFASVTPAPIVSSVASYTKQASYVQQPTISTFVKPSVASYNYNAGFAQQKQIVQPVVQHSSVVHQAQPAVQTYTSQPIVQKQIFQQTYVQKPVVQHHSYEYVQQPILKTPVVQETYVQQPPVSSQVFHQSSAKSQQYAQKQYVSSTAAPVVYDQPAFIKYDAPKAAYKAPEYLPPQYSTSAPSLLKYKQQQSTVHTYSSPQVVVPFVSSTPAPVSFAPTSFVDLVSPKKSFAYEAPAYVQPKVTYSRPAYVSSTPAPIKYQQQSVVHTYTQPKLTAPVVSSTPFSVNYEPVKYTAPQKQYEFRAPEYIPPKVSYSSTPSPVRYQQQSVVHTYESPKIVAPVVSSTPVYYESFKKPSAEYKAVDYSYNYKSETPKVVRPFAVSSTPATVRFEQTHYKAPSVQTYEVPQYQQQYIQVSTPAPFVYEQPIKAYKPSKIVESFQISSNNDQQAYVASSAKTFQQQQQYVNVQTYQSPKIQSSTYLPPKVEVYQETYTPTAPTVSYKPVKAVFKGPDYLPPVKAVKTVYEQPQVNVNQYTVTQAPLKYYSSTPLPVTFNVNPIEEFAFNKIAVTPKPTVVYKQPVLIQQTYQPAVVSTQRPIVYKTPAVSIDYTNEKQVNLLGFGTVGLDAGLVGSGGYSSTEAIYTAPVSQRVVKTKKIVSSTYRPVTQKYVEVTPPVRKLRPKVAVVTKVNDFNPLLVRKLGAVCSCRSNVLRLRKKKPEPEPQVEYEYDGDYEVPVNGDDDDEWTYKADSFDDSSYTPSFAPVKSANPTVSAAYLPVKPTAPIVIRKPKITLVSSTLSPIVVAEDLSGYDGQKVAVKPAIKSTLRPIVVNEEENYPYLNVSPDSGSKYVSTTGAPIRGRPIRVKSKAKAVTVAPTYASVLIPETQSAKLVGESRQFDRYGPGGWRSRDETLQGTVDCQRAGLFRHPKHCNKFYSCVWDCTKNRFTLHVFNCPVQLSFDPNMGACNWPSQGPACQGDTLLPSGY